MYKSAIRILGVNFGLISNNESLVRAGEFLDEEEQRRNPAIWSILTALPAPERIEYEDEKMDARFYMMDIPGAGRPEVIYRGDRCILTGDFSAWEAGERDKRWNIYGNVGIFFAFCLTMLERFAGIHSMHASALYHEEKNLLLVVAGSSGCGKTVLQLEALLNHGYKVFTTEMTHFRVEEQGCTFFKGSIYDNIRVGNLIYDFPQAVSRFRIHVPEVEDTWETYLAVDLGPWSPAQDRLHNPQVVVLFPRIETGRESTILNVSPGKGGFIRSMFENASEKICKSQVMYGDGACSCFASFDTQEMALKRLDDIRKLLDMEFVIKRMKLLSGPQDCWAWERAL